MYDSAADADRYLKGTIIRLEKEPIYIQGSSYSRGRVLLKYHPIIGSKKVELISCKDEALDYNPVNLGYCSDGRNLGYLLRMPSRTWKQGLSSKNLRVIGDLYFAWMADDLSRKLLYKAIKGNGTPYKKALEGVNGGVINRRLSVHPATKNLHYRGSIVGVAKEKEIILVPAFSYLDKLVEEATRVRTSVI